MGRAIRILENVQTVMSPLMEGMDAHDYAVEFSGVLMDLKDADDPNLYKEAEAIIHKNLGLKVNLKKDSIDDVSGDMVQSEPRSWSRTLAQLKDLT
jgi:hypothetical protein